jgi:hypothetical protein
MANGNQDHQVPFGHNRPGHCLQEVRQLRGGNYDVIAYSDADWAGDKKTRKSTTGGVIILAGGPVSWISTRQRSIALSTQEAELMSMTEICKDVIYLNQLDQSCGMRRAPPKICNDNMGAELHAAGEASSNRRGVRHIDIRYKFMEELTKEKKIVIQHVDGKENLADLMTKPLSVQRLTDLRDQMMYQ